MGCVPHPAASNSPAAAEPVRLGHCCPFELQTPPRMATQPRNCRFKLIDNGFLFLDTTHGLLMQTLGCPRGHNPRPGQVTEGVLCVSPAAGQSSTHSCPGDSQHSATAGWKPLFSQWYICIINQALINAFFYLNWFSFQSSLCQLIC